MTPDFWLGLTSGILVGAVLAAVLFAWAGYDAYRRSKLIDHARNLRTHRPLSARIGP